MSLCIFVEKRKGGEYIEHLFPPEMSEFEKEPKHTHTHTHISNSVITIRSRLASTDTTYQTIELIITQDNQSIHHGGRI